VRRASGHARARRVATSVVMKDLLADLPAERVTLAWLIDRLGDRSFGIILLLVALLGVLPGVSAVAGVLLVIPAFQMVRAHYGPIFPHRLASFGFRTRRVVGAIRRIIPVLQYLERFIRPRWPTPFESTKRAVGVVVLLLGFTLLVPIPFSNVAPASLVGLIAFAYLEEDGALLCGALAAAILLLTILAAIIWEALSLSGWIPRFL
jgi:hypothetical protein